MTQAASAIAIVVGGLVLAGWTLLRGVRNHALTERKPPRLEMER